MSVDYSIISIEDEWKTSDEMLGSKAKFWFRMPGKEEDTRWLFKYARLHTGEHWAEKVSSEIAAELLKLPTHEVKLAEHNKNRGCAVKSFLQHNEDLIHGNEILAATIKGYEKDRIYHHSAHCLPNIILGLERILERVNKMMLNKFVSQEIFSDERKAELEKRGGLFPLAGHEGKDLFRSLVGYLVLDALVGNTDRHHENWGCIFEMKIGSDDSEDGLTLRLLFQLAPTFDHGSSLGRECLEERRQLLLRDEKAFQAYLRRGRGGIFENEGDKHPLSPLGVVSWISKNYPEYWKPWRETVSNLEKEDFLVYLDRVPNEWMSSSAKKLAFKLLVSNLSSLQEIQ